MSKNTVIKQQAAAKAEVILLGIDVHADKQVVVRRIDGQMPQPAQQFTREQLVAWIGRQRKLANKVCSCYEAGPFGCGLHRELEALGVENLLKLLEPLRRLIVAIEQELDQATASIESQATPAIRGQSKLLDKTFWLFEVRAWRDNCGSNTRGRCIM
jgi:hypothetical protein